MLREDLDQHISLHHALGFKFRTQALLLRNFVAYAEVRGDQIVSADRVLAWAVQAPSPEQRRNRLLEARRFAIAMHAQDSRHEIPPPMRSGVACPPAGCPTSTARTISAA